MKYVLDTHTLIWFLEGNSRLGNRTREILFEPTSDLILPAIALAEAVWIVARGKTSIPSAEAILAAIGHDRRITIYPLDKMVIEQTLKLVNIHEMHDRQIVATVMVLAKKTEQVVLLTCDQNITASNWLRLSGDKVRIDKIQRFIKIFAHRDSACMLPNNSLLFRRF